MAQQKGYQIVGFPGERGSTATAGSTPVIIAHEFGSKEAEETLEKFPPPPWWAFWRRRVPLYQPVRDIPAGALSAEVQAKYDALKAAGKNPFLFSWIYGRNGHRLQELGIGFLAPTT